MKEYRGDLPHLSGVVSWKSSACSCSAASCSAGSWTSSREPGIAGTGRRRGDARQCIAPGGGLSAPCSRLQRHLDVELSGGRVGELDSLRIEGLHELQVELLLQLDQLLDDLTEGTEGRFTRPVRIFPIAYGADADLATLREIAEASNAAVYSAADPATIDRVLTAVISNF